MNYDAIQHVDNINVHKGKRERDYKTQPHHYHNWYEIFIVLTGSCKFSVYDRFYKVEAGNAMLLEPGVFHYYTSDSGCEYIIIEVTAGYISRYFSAEAANILLDCFNLQTIALNPDELAECIRLSEIADNESNTSASDKFLAIGSVFNVLSRSVKQCPHKKTWMDSKRKNTLEKLNYVTNYISEHFKEINSINDLAKACYISKSHLCRIFKQELGISVSSYINNMKINTARDLLLSSNMSILDIAVESGFNSTQYFHKVFKAQLGCSPKEYRMH